MNMRVAAIFAAGFCTFINMYTPQAFLPVLAADLRSTPTQVGLSITVTLLAVAMVAPVVGAISDQLGRKRLIVAASLLVVIPSLLISTSQSLAALLLWRFVMGLMLPFIFTVTVAYVADEFSGAEAIRVPGIYTSGSIFGGFFGRFFGGLITDFSGWRGVFVVLAVVTAAGAMFVWRYLPREQRFRPVIGGFSATVQSYREHLRNRRLLGTCAVGFGMLFCQVATFTFVNFLLAAAPFNLSTSQLGTVFAVYLLGMVTTPLATRVAVKIGRRRSLVAACSIAASGLALTLGPALWMVVAGLAFLAGGLFIVQALSMGFIGTAVPRARSSAVGMYVTAFYIGGAIGGVAPGGAWFAFGWPGVVGCIWVMLALMVAAGLRAWSMPKPG
jgi:predicted MFS family arabinose efflux permease